jgi:hypothetical protein
MGKASRSKATGKPAVGTAVLWAVLVDGRLADHLFPDMRAAKTAALALREDMPASTVEWAQVGITLLMRRPLRPKIDVVRLGAPS